MSSPEPKTVARRSFSIRRMQLWTLVPAVLLTLVSTLPTTTGSASGASVCVLLYVLLDAVVTQEQRYSGILAASYFTNALAVAVATSFAILMLFPPPAPPKPVLTFFEFASQLASGAIIHEFATGLARAIQLIVNYFLTFAGLTLVSFVTAIAGWKKPGSQWLVMLNLPGLAFITYFLVAGIIEEATKS